MNKMKILVYQVRIPIILGRELFEPIITAGWLYAPWSPAAPAFGVPDNVASCGAAPPSVSSMAGRVEVVT